MTDREMSTPSMPAVFVGHGNPMYALETNRWTTAWAEFAAGIARPRAIVAISAHWYLGATAVTAMAAPRTIHDFAGFPPELFAVEYPAPGSPELAERVAALVGPIVDGDVERDHGWGLDHGTWAVLTHMYPTADVPVVQLSIDARHSVDGHLAVGAALAPLRDEGVLVLASGNVVHNLGAVRWGVTDTVDDWARDYDRTATALVQDRPGDIAQLFTHPAHRMAAPTPEHLLPLVYLAGLATVSATGSTRTLVEGYDMANLSMTCHVLA